ncbi:hypothetical protein [Agaribacterium sp. ZY112]|uniref:hypothetical protein n=1 Tax=Agaribacterium sp. ZY112 TaxID=3233574 RepID=UPI003525CFF9
MGSEEVIQQNSKSVLTLALLLSGASPRGKQCGSNNIDSHLHYQVFNDINITENHFQVEKDDNIQPKA